MKPHSLQIVFIASAVVMLMAGCAPAAPSPTTMPTAVPPTAVPPTPTLPPPPPTAIPANTLAAYRMAEPPVVDGSIDEVWANVPALEISSPALSLKAIYTAKDLYILAIVPDTTASFTRGGWVWDGAQWSTVRGQSEDRLAIMWSMDTPNFENVGCMTKCHPGTHAEGGEDDAWLETGKADMWHMKAARYLPIAGLAQTGQLTVDPTTHAVTGGMLTFMGWTDDKWTGQWSADNAPDGGRYGDAGSGADKRNRTEDKTAPVYIETAPTDFADAMVLLKSEIDSGEAVKIADLTAEQLQAAWNQYASLNAVVPERFLTPPTGSRADVIQAATWKDGVWTLEYQRALDTGHPADDVIFSDLSKPYLFGVAWMDNTDGAGHIPSGILTLIFVP